MRTRSIFVAGVLTLGLVATACTIQPGGSSSSGSPAVGDAFGGTTGAPLPAVDEPIEAVTQRALPAVVNVTSDVVTAQGQAGQGVGTGFIVRSDGVVVTNCHVVEGATRITVFTSAKQPEKFDARVIGGDCEHDLAVLKIDGKNLPTVPLGSSSDLQLGQSVVAIGYALALEGGPSVTTGIVSSLDRVVQVQDPNCEVCQNGSRTYSNVIQTDAAINHGNSGGPLLNLQGEVVGINSAGADTAENIGFAIAIDAAKQTIQQAINEPLAATGYIGVSTQTVTADMAYQMDLTVDRRGVHHRHHRRRPGRRCRDRVRRRDHVGGRPDHPQRRRSRPRARSAPARRHGADRGRPRRPGAIVRRDARRPTDAHPDAVTAPPLPRWPVAAALRAAATALAWVHEDGAGVSAPFEPGERVVLLDQRGRTYVFVAPGGRHISHAFRLARARPHPRAARRGRRSRPPGA